VVKHHGLVRPVKGTQPQVHHAGGMAAAVINRCMDVSGQRCQGEG